GSAFPVRPAGRPRGRVVGWWKPYTHLKEPSGGVSAQVTGDGGPAAPYGGRLDRRTVRPGPGADPEAPPLRDAEEGLAVDLQADSRHQAGVARRDVGVPPDALERGGVGERGRAVHVQDGADRIEYLLRGEAGPGPDVCACGVVQGAAGGGCL